MVDQNAVGAALLGAVDVFLHGLSVCPVPLRINTSTGSFSSAGWKCSVRRTWGD